MCAFEGAGYWRAGLGSCVNIPITSQEGAEKTAEICRINKIKL